MATDPGFVHLHVHSSYSLLEGALTIGKLAELAKADKQPALALTDTDNMFGALEFSEKLASSGIQPIVGCALAVDFGDETRDPRLNGRVPDAAAHRAARAARGRLSQPDAALLARLPRNAAQREAAPAARLARGRSDGLIALTGGPTGPLDAAIAAGQAELAAARCDSSASVCSATGSMSNCSGTARAAERAVEPALVELAYASGMPLVATNEPFFAKREDYEAHDALICIAEGRLVAETDRRQLTAEHYFKSRAEMAALFADLPEALASTVEIAQRCAFRPRTRRADPAALLGRRSHASTKRPNCATAPRRASTRRVAAARPRCRPHHRGIPRAARLRAQGHRGDEISRLLPHRRRTSSNGRRSRAFRSGPAAARAPARWSPMR